MDIREGGLGDPRVEALIRHHRDESRSTTPECNAHSLDSNGLAASGVFFFAAWDGETLLGIGALKGIDAYHAELKSMRTAPAHLGKGVARALLDHIVGVAHDRGFTRLSLETGTAPMFAPAITMYERYGFTVCDAFGGYPASPHNLFMTIDL
ncbi:MAG: GNAT family N-acetyltransferase [Pseudomonadota bacterium]|nr:GNAT family N-acetyltransferase [Pseudomonadota bacterium]